jgi:hypothetical protein
MLMTERTRFFHSSWIAACAILLSALFALAGYKTRPWSIRPAESYAARLTSEGVTIAVEPMFQDALAAQFFDKNDIVTRGIMPVAVAIYNQNDFPVMVQGTSVELICGEDRVRTLFPNEVVPRLFAKGKNVWLPQPIPRTSNDQSNREAIEDFDHKFLNRKVVPGREKGGGFLYLRISEIKDIRGYLEKARLYIPEVYRYDTGKSMIFFEIDLHAAVAAKN